MGLDDEDDMFEDEGSKQKRRKEEIRKEIRALKKELLKGDTDNDTKVDKENRLPNGLERNVSGIPVFIMINNF